ncbi:putative glucosyl/glucuronosyl transferase [Phaeosphaeria sp. MPI-PUGE-AT-0046c]|nr:putative glucosyl/glucuronosyl transferase [Phaeosphaeria sp. MPI-PUGE-AT-0046c]
MAERTTTGEGHAVSDTVIQQTILEQAQAAAAAQTDPAGATRQQDILQNTDLITPDASEGTEDDIPPPAYGDIYGEIRTTEKDGLNTSARVADDGRVNIRINGLTRRASQIFTPALRQHAQSAQDDEPPPPVYIPPSLGGQEGIFPPPALNVVIQVVGSRGDVQPFVALGKILKDTYGHRVRLATHPNFKDFVQENGLEFFSIGGDPSQLMAFMVKNPGLMPGFNSIVRGDVSQRRRDVAEYIQGCWRSCYQAGDGMRPRSGIDEDASSETAARPFIADCIIANPPSFAHIHCAEKLGVPLHIMFTMPYSPTQAFPHPLANIQSSDADPHVTNYISYAMIEVLAWQGLGDIINRFRKKCLGLDPVTSMWAPGMLQRLKVPHTYCWSPALIPKPRDWATHISIAGFYFLNLASNYSPSPELQAFLDAGPPPVYIGFGSIVLDDPDGMTQLIFEAVEKTGQRVLLSKGWGGMGAEKLTIPDNVHMLGNVPHDWLFKHVSCVVHHGGAGTTAAGISAGRPTLIVPFFGDQAFWGAMIARAGAGPDPIPHKQLTAHSLAEAINFCLKPESLERAQQLADKIAAERGCDKGAQSFHQFLEADRIRCALAPSRAASWRVRRSQVRLSAFAACTLAKADLLDFHDLKLFRAREYYTDEGPVDPISGGFITACRKFSNMGKALVDIPTETWKVVTISSGSRGQQSEASATTSRDDQTTHQADDSKSATSPVSSQMTLNRPDKREVGSAPKLSRLSSRTSTLKSSSTSDALQGQWDPAQEPSQDKDMMRHTGAHMSKGVGKFVRTLVQAPIDMSVSFTKGFHNAPKMWGDDTVRPQERITDFKSGMRAVGKEFGYGFYDGLTGLVTQPWNGAKKEGAAGFAKGVGKGIGGFFTKLSAAHFSILGYTLKGVHKQVQSLFGNNVENYIITSRVAQGYEDWLQSSNAEREDVIIRWKLIQKHLKKKSNPDEMLQDILDNQQKSNVETAGAREDASTTQGHTPHTSSNSLSSGTQDFSSLTLDPQPAENPAPVSRNPLPVEPASEINVPRADANLQGGIEDDSKRENAIQESATQPRGQDDFTIGETDDESLRQAIASSEVEDQRHATEAAEFEAQIKRVMAESIAEHTQMNSSSVSNREMHGVPSSTSSPMMGSSAQQPPAYDPAHLAGTTQSEFEAQQQGEKTTQERTEEQIVMEYVMKQSLLEAHHKGKGRATDEEDLQKALDLSLQDDQHDRKQ